MLVNKYNNVFNDIIKSFVVKLFSYNFSVKNYICKRRETEQFRPSAELQKRITDAFCIFDHVGDKTIDVREVGTILRFLGCVPTEKEVNDIITQIETEDSEGEVHLTKFLPYITQLLTDHRMEPAGPEELLEAFRVLDEDDQGYLEPEYLSKLMMEEGEPFTQEEVDEMLATAIDPLTGHINYEYYLNQLMDIKERLSISSNNFPLPRIMRISLLQIVE
uniref:EF-hand domain-containing protein n=1 Tax=Glossina brevipalpis TaxID=37001 RepID=A0A1A9WWL3_9MUSC